MVALAVMAILSGIAFRQGHDARDGVRAHVANAQTLKRNSFTGIDGMEDIMGRDYNTVQLIRFVRVETDEPEVYDNRKDLLSEMRQIEDMHGDDVRYMLVDESGDEIPLMQIVGGGATIGGE